MRANDMLIIIAGVLGVAAYVVLFTNEGKKMLNSVTGMMSGYGGASAYQVSANTLPYDPNNYYYPPRDRSIMP